MQRKRHSSEQIIRKLREAEVELANGASIAEVCKKLGVSENTFTRWRTQHGNMTTDDVRRLKDLEKENQRLKQAVADLILDKQILQEALRGNS
jgi:putative transposase